MDWHLRYLQQARWTRESRRYLYRKARLPLARRILDVGCGTGALLGELESQSSALVCGVDISSPNLHTAASISPSAHLTQADALKLPFPEDTFDICLCHFLLLWVRDPERAVYELARVVKPGGAVLLLAEPDYGGRIDYPEPLVDIGKLQVESLRRQGADPLMGRRLSGLLHSAGLHQIETAVLGGSWSVAPDEDELAVEWKVLETDLEGVLPAGELDRLKNIDQKAWKAGERVLFVPTFYGMGVK